MVEKGEGTNGISEEVEQPARGGFQRMMGGSGGITIPSEYGGFGLSRSGRAAMFEGTWRENFILLINTTRQ